LFNLHPDLPAGGTGWQVKAIFPSLPPFVLLWIRPEEQTALV
jgi:hypothetical protein